VSILHNIYMLRIRYSDDIIELVMRPVGWVGQHKYQKVERWLLASQKYK